jgi:predicted dehydrogenase
MGVKKKIAIIGAGYMANEHAKAHAALGAFELAGIYSRTRHRAEQVAKDYNIPVVADSVAELYERTKATMVIITVRELAMREVALEAAKYDWTLLLEKPAGYCLGDAQAIAHGLAGKPAFVALNRRYYHATQAALEDLNRRDMKRFIHVQDQQSQLAAQDSQPQTVIDYWMYANSVHLIDYFTLFGRGEVVRVIPHQPWEPKKTFNLTASILFSSGDEGLYQAIWEGPGPWAISVTTAQKRFEMRPLEQGKFQNTGERILHDIVPHPWDLLAKPGLMRLAEECRKYHESAPHLLVSVEESMRSMELVHAIYGC